MILFDFVVGHNLLLQKFKSPKLLSSVFEWFESYLSNQGEWVRTSKGDLSNWVEVRRKVHQGSFLASTMFKIYTLDLGGELKYCKYHKYADDMILHLLGPAKDLENIPGRV